MAASRHLATWGGHVGRQGVTGTLQLLSWGVRQGRSAGRDKPVSTSSGIHDK